MEPAIRAGSSLEKIDGRRARGERARAAVVDAILDLLQEGDLRPTAERIAARAGVSLRLVFHHFADIESLYAAAADRQTERLTALFKPISADGPFAARLEAFLQQRARMWERIAPVRRASLLLEPFSDEIRRRLAAAREEMSHYGEFDYVIVNEHFDTAVDEMCAIFTASRLRRDLQKERHAALIEGLLAE
ncbi:MAG TPA: TetR family transcriptional regulator [Candidatus Binataceae bacterium]|nr:TetR family transcriptional regulator [Candidatus Binataceae bacterium]